MTNSTLINDKEVLDQELDQESKIITPCQVDKSRNSFNLSRARYFGHLLGGIKTALYSRFISKRPRPFTFSHMVTSICNCDCDFCYWKHSQGKDDLSLSAIKRIYKEAKQEGYMNCILWGGEPLMRDDITEICKTAHDNGLYTKVATNGWFLEENYEFAKYTDLMFTSLDALGEKHESTRGNLKGLYERTLKGIEFHKKHSPHMRIYVCCTVSKAHPIEDIIEVAELCKDMDILLYLTVNKSNQCFEKGEDNSKELEYSADELSDIFKKLKEMKQQGYPIRNSYYFMDYLIEKKNYYECHWPRIATVMYSNGDLLRCYDRQPFLNIADKPLGEALRSKEFIEMANQCTDCKLACVGNYALDASGLWKIEWQAIKSIAEIAIT